MNVIDEPKSVSGRRIDHIAGQRHFHGTAFTDEASQTLRAAAAAHDA